MATALRSAGQLRRLVTLEQPMLSPANAAGERAETWNDVAQVWVAIEPIRADEIIRGERQIGAATHVVRLRWTPGLAVTATMRLNLGAGRIMHILSVLNVDERNRQVELRCQEEV